MVTPSPFVDDAEPPRCTLVSLSRRSLHRRGGELCPAAAEGAGLSENGDCQIRAPAADSRMYSLGFSGKSYSEHDLTH
jgi:hypothetical protein